MAPGLEPDDPPVDTTPDFRAVARALGVERSRDLVHRVEQVLSSLREQAPKLEKALAPILSSKGGTLRICGVTASGEATLFWDDSGCPAELQAPGDFSLAAVARKRSKTYHAKTTFAAVAPFSPAQELAAAHALVEHFRGSDAAILDAARRDFPRLYAFLGRLSDLKNTSLICVKPDHIAIRLVAPSNRAAIKQHYASLDSVHGWVRDLRITAADEDGRVLGCTRFDGSRRIFYLDAFASGGHLLCSDGRRPLRDRNGDPLAVDFKLTEDRTFRLCVDVTASLLRLGRLRFGSVRLPTIRLGLRFVGSSRGDRATWEVCVEEISPPRAPLRWLLPLERIFKTIEESFRLRISLSPRAPDAALHDLEIEYQLETVRSAVLELAEALLRWGSRSSVFRDLLGLWHDFVAALAEDLERLGESAPPG